MAIECASGVAVQVRRITAGPAGHFFGYYDMPAWDMSDRWMLAQRVTRDVGIPTSGDMATIGLIDTQGLCRFEPVATTRTWSWQQGAMLHWLPKQGPRTFVHNDIDRGRFVARVRDIDSGVLRVLDRPIAALTHDQSRALSLNFARLRVRPEVGYPGVPDPWEGVDHSEDDGIFVVDLESGSSRLVASLDAIVTTCHDPSMDGAVNWVNHLIVSPDDAAAMFVHRWWPPSAPRFRTRFMLLTLDDFSIREIWPARVSHMCWRSPTEIVFTGVAADVEEDPFAPTIPYHDMGFRILDVAMGNARRIGAQLLPPDGHCTYRPGGRYILTDTPVDQNGMRGLLIFDELTERVLSLARFHVPSRYQGSVRCDLHPRWNRGGTSVCIDSVHEGSRQMYVLDVSDALRAWSPEVMQ